MIGDVFYNTQFIDFISHPIYWKNKSGLYVNGNKAFVSCLGFSKIEDIIGKTDQELHSSELANAIIQHDQTILEQGGTQEVLELWQTKKQQVIECNTRKMPWRDDKNEIIGIIGYIQEISLHFKENKKSSLSALLHRATEEVTKRNVSQQEITELMCEYLDSIISLLPVNIFWEDKNGRFLGCNNRVAELLGFSSPEEIIGKTLYDFYPGPPDVVQKLLTNDRQVIETNQPLTREEMGLNEAGELSTYLTHRFPMHDNENNVVGLLGIAFDFVEKKRFETSLIKENQLYQQQLRKNEQELAKIYSQITGQPTNTKQSLLFYVTYIRDYLEKIIALMPGTVYWTDRNGTYLGCNDNVVKLFHLKSRQDFIGKKISEFTSKEVAEGIMRNDQEVMQSGKMVRYDNEIGVDEHGNIANYLTYKVPLFSPQNEVTGVLGISVDITARKKMEEQLQTAKEEAEAANLAKTEFIRNMSHDLRTPLASIIGALNVLREKESDSNLKEFIEQSYDAAKALLNTFNDILEASKIDFGQEKEQLSDFSLPNLIGEVAKLYTPVVLEKNLNLYIAIDQNIPAFVTGKRRLLHRILLNLIGNAVKFTNVGIVTIEAKVLSRENNTITLELNIKDTGIGIPEEKLKEIFLPFSRLTSSYENHIEGSGLGLHIVNQFAEVVGGKIAVKSALNRGSIFTLVIPMQIARMDESVPQVGIMHETNVDAEHKIEDIHLLLVEDNLFAQRMAKVNLENWGYYVDVANDGKEAIEKCTKKLYDLIYMDMGLPNQLDGCDTAKLIKMHSINQYTPVIALTAHADKKVEEDCSTVGIQTVLEKPLTKEKVIDIYKIYLSDKCKSVTSVEKITVFSNFAEKKTMLVSFMERFPEEQMRLNAAMSSGNISRMCELLHSIIGALSYCDVPEVLAAAKKLYLIAKEGDNKNIQKFYVEFEKVLNAAVKNIYSGK